MVGIVAFNTAVIEDQSDEEQAPDNLFTPALTRPFLKCCVNYSQTGLQVTGGNRFVPTVISEIDRLFPSDGPQFQALAPTVEPRAQRAIKPEAIALAAFGCIVALACLLLAVQLIGRQLRLRADEREVLRALGSSPGQTVLDGVIGILASVVTGTALAVGVAVALSPIAPLGPVRSVFPYPGLNFDWTVLGLGSLVLVSGLTLATLALSYLGAPHRAVGHPLRSYQQPSRVVCRDGRRWPPCPGCDGRAFRSRPGQWPDLGPRALSRPRYRPGLDCPHRHSHFWGQPWFTGISSGSIRVELGLLVGGRRRPPRARSDVFARP